MALVEGWKTTISRRSKRSGDKKLCFQTRTYLATIRPVRLIRIWQTNLPLSRSVGCHAERCIKAWFSRNGISERECKKFYRASKNQILTSAHLNRFIKSSFDFDYPELVYPATGDIEITCWRRCHVTHHTCAREHWPAGKCFSPRIKPHDCVRV